LPAGEPAATELQAPGFRAGFGAVFGGLGFLFRTPRAWPYAMVPAAILTALTLLLGFAALSQLQPLFEGWFGNPTSWWGRLGAELISWLGAVLAAVLGIVIALALTPPLSSPALERIVALQERELGAPPRSELGFLAEMWCGLRAQFAAAVFAGPLLLLLAAVDLVFAPAAIVTIPLKLLVAAFALAWNLFDYPLTLRGVRVRQRLKLVRAYKSTLLGFGLSFALLFWLPCLGVVLLPVGVAAATKLLWRILERDPSAISG
jgi:CysZ protein